KRRALARLVEQARAGGNLRLARADLGGVRELLRALKRHEAIGMLPDQVPGGGEGVWAEFFNRPAYTMTLAARLAAVGATLLLAHAERLPAGAGFRLALRAPGPLPPGPPAVQAAAINRMLESLIRSCPQQYLWGYNRYKRPAGAPEPAGAAPGAGDRRC
ncbi:MAG: lipid A biosynthesis acyltransferase, partial [Rhodocyclales bacterium CG17_big_fil_post_rev_8_21_14_2_50_68_7]